MLSKKIRIGYISPNNPLDRRASSGTTYYMYKALEQIGAKVVWVQVKRTWVYNIVAVIYKFLSILTKTRILKEYTIVEAILASKSLDRKLIGKCDILFAPFSSVTIFSLETKKPIIYLSDATFALMVDYYFKNIPKWNIREANKIEHTVLSKVSYAVLASDWAYNSVKSDYKISQEKLAVIEFGANIDEENIIPHLFEYKSSLDILFMGVDWIRKGGDIAVDACRYLNQIGIRTTLHIVGIQNLDDSIATLPFVRNYGFLNKNNPDSYKTLVSIIQKSHCLLLPTHAECAGIVFCECSANGLPIFTYDTGGISNYVLNGVNGYRLPVKATGVDFGQKICDCLESGELSEMSTQAVRLYKEKLNWTKWGTKMEQIISTLLA